MNKSKILVVSIALVVVLLIITSAFLDTQSTTGISVEKDYEVTKITKAEALSKLGRTDVVKANGSTLLNASLSELNHMLNNSKISVVENINQEEIATIAEKLNARFYSVELADGQQTIGAVITKDNSGKIKVTEVIAEVADELIGGKLIRTDAEKAASFLEWLGKNATLDIDGIYNDFESTTSENAVNAAASLFGDVSVFRYLYTAPYAEDSTEYESSPDSSRYLLATTKVVLYGYKAKTSGTTTYDSFKADIYVNPKNALKVHTFNTNLYTTTNTRYDILSATVIESDSSSKTGGKEVTNKLFLTEYEHQWVAKPISPKKEASYNIKPGMVVKATNGTGQQNLVTASLSYLKLKKAAGAYWVSNRDVIVNLKYKNHKQV